MLEKRGPETKTLRSGLAAHWHYGLAGEQPELLREETSLRNFKLELDSQTSLQVGHCWIKCSATKIRDLRPGSLPHCQARACFQLLSCPQAGHLHRTLALTGMGDMIRVRSAAGSKSESLARTSTLFRPPFARWSQRQRGLVTRAEKDLLSSVPVTLTTRNHHCLRLSSHGGFKSGSFFLPA